MKKIGMICLLAMSGRFGLAQETTSVLYNGIIVSGLEDTMQIQGVDLGEVKFKDRILTLNCSYPEVINRLVKQAKANGANLIKITMHRYPDIWSSCHRMKAEAYKVADPDRYERQIDWSPDRKLKTSDFKGKPDDIYSNSVVALTNSGFGVETNRVTFFKSPKYFVYCRFFCYDSWMKLAGRDDPKVLQHEQTHFDLCEVYARKLLQALEAAHLAVTSLDRLNDIYHKIYDSYLIRQKQYDLETRHGVDFAEQERWNGVIAGELKELEGFKIVE